MAKRQAFGPGKLTMPTKREITSLKRWASRLKVRYSPKKLVNDIFYFYKLKTRVESKSAKKKQVKQTVDLLAKKYGKSGLLTRVKRVQSQYMKMLSDPVAVKYMDIMVHKNQSWPKFDLLKEGNLTREELLATLSAMESQLKEAYGVYMQQDMLNFIDFALLNKTFYYKIQNGYIDASAEQSIINLRAVIEDHKEIDDFSMKKRQNIVNLLHAIYQLIGIEDTEGINYTAEYTINYILIKE